MKRFVTALWRWALILSVYLLLGFPVVGLVIPGAAGQAVQIPMLLQRALQNAAFGSGFIPDSVYYEGWQFFVSSYAMNCLFLSLLLVALWNVLYAPFALGRNHEKSARTAVWVFALLHVALLLFYAFFVFTLASYIWDWLILQPMGLSMLLLLPGLLIVPFILSIRGLCPYRIYNVFPLFARLRVRMGLRIFSKRGPA